MGDNNTAGSLHYRSTDRYRGRLLQFPVYLRRLVRTFFYYSDWKVFPFSALVTGLVALVVRNNFFTNMEGLLEGALALTFIGIWNGFFNSIQIICREWQSIRREYREGMHITAYVGAHMVFQAILCALESALSLYICTFVGIRFPEEGMFTPWMILDIGITVFLVTYAADVMCLWVSSLFKKTLTAMSIVPFLLIFQLFFSNSLFELPEPISNLSSFTFSSYGVRSVAALGDYNNLPIAIVWNLLENEKDREFSLTIRGEQVLDLLSNDNNGFIKDLKTKELGREFTIGEVWDKIKDSGAWKEIKRQEVDATITLGQLLEFLRTEGSLEKFRETDLKLFTMGDLLANLQAIVEKNNMQDIVLGKSFTIGEVVQALNLEQMMEDISDTTIDARFTLEPVFDFLNTNPEIQKYRDQSFTISVTVGQLINMVGEERVREFLVERTAQASRRTAFEKTEENVARSWATLGLFILLFLCLTIFTLLFFVRKKNHR